MAIQAGTKIISKKELADLERKAGFHIKQSGLSATSVQVNLADYERLRNMVNAKILDPSTGRLAPMRQVFRKSTGLGIAQVTRELGGRGFQADFPVQRVTPAEVFTAEFNRKRMAKNKASLRSFGLPTREQVVEAEKLTQPNMYEDAFKKIRAGRDVQKKLDIFSKFFPSPGKQGFRFGVDVARKGREKEIIEKTLRGNVSTDDNGFTVVKGDKKDKGLLESLEEFGDKSGKFINKYGLPILTGLAVAIIVPPIVSGIKKITK